MSRLRRALRQVLWLAVLLAVSAGVMDYLRQPRLPPNLPETLHTLEGRPLSLTALSAERPLLIYVWASWCSICRVTSPTVDGLASRGENVVTVALRSGDDASLTQALARRGLRFPVVNDAKGALAASWQIGVTPTFIILYRGRVTGVTTGWSSYPGLWLRLHWPRWFG
ncbi:MULTISPECIES: protein disulfide oxidoreductase [Edwardsiella]|uniref:Membrane protein, suppressor for copper-sensitivity ScsD n=2 Tax=Edwardsiella anguillarum TaxID=1821960 RepID=A0A076LK11_9GAMM|nr:MULTISPECIES: protein disulfide oxidoreductase [Edwardsiella]AKM47316.1 alkyl hydroperoxide reductase [Edwardsiella sp. EA181011]GAJ65976.1 antioxidant, AhpC/TSA family [Edwardsiella piscicida]AIJ06923.1 Membrane protein, suppressor for copper-sensitivity ScsD [Edwardsiella anguillarum ET080813]AKR78356.1 protein disulfide oxidoreductase [Edwardsiella sp. LADL05-105]KAB0593509.1 protein disulfide oxidoreductase [Edwardsiella anguillarum]